jgi:2,4-dienoyl-CoA reductase-like NADH-dependent reductase (Old Yellow Enzyme family)
VGRTFETLRLFPRNPGIGENGGAILDDCFLASFYGYPADVNALAHFGMPGNAAIAGARARSSRVRAGAASGSHCTSDLVRINRLQRLCSRREGAAITSIDKLIEMVVRNEVDLVAVGRALLVDPAWATKVRDNRMQELLPFTAESLRFLS